MFARSSSRLVSACCLCLVVFLSVSGLGARAAELVVNGGFEAGFTGWDGDSSTIANDGYFSGHSARLINGKSRFTQQLLDDTPAGCYLISFRVKNAPGQVAADNSMDVQFNHDELVGNLVPFPAPQLPLKDHPVSGAFGWASFSFFRCIFPSDADPIADLRLRFHGEGFLVDSVSVNKI